VPYRYSLWRPPLVLRGASGSRYLEAAARPLATVATLVDGYACQLGHQGLGHAANVRMVRRNSSQRAAIAADDYRTVLFLEFGEATQLIECLDRRLEPRVRAIRPRGMLFG
jgi:hypothetical protein